MKTFLAAATLVAASTSLTLAGGIDRSGQPVRALFEEGGETGSYVEFSFRSISPKASISALPVDPLKAYSSIGVAVKQQWSEQLSAALIIDEPIGAGVDYRPVFPGFAYVESTSITGLLRYKFDENFSVHGGLRFQDLRGELQTVVGGVQPANVLAGSDMGMGYVIGGAYERPDIALRVALTYSSEVDVTLTGSETFLDGAFVPVVTVPTTFSPSIPASVNLDFQTGIAADTLLFGSIRYVEWEGFNLTTTNIGQYVNFRDDATTYTLGLGRRFSDAWSAAVTLGYEAQGTRPGNTLLNPTTGFKSIGIGATYTSGNIKVSGGITYAELGDQNFDPNLVLPGGGTFDDNHAVGAGLRVGFNF
ncbi:MAG: outer membrane protein transport protein [Paracoccaceae bacterium]